MIKRNHRIAIKTCKNFQHRHYANLVQKCDEVLKEYINFSVEIVTGQDRKANRWVDRYACKRGSLRKVDTPKQMIEYSDVIILFGIDDTLEKIASMAKEQNLRVIRFSLY